MAPRGTSGIDRRCQPDNRKAYDLGYFANGGEERRAGRERRDATERRVGWIRTEGFNSVYLGSIVSLADSRGKSKRDLEKRVFKNSVQDESEQRRYKRHVINKYAYVVYKPGSKRIGRIMDINRRGLRCRFRGHAADLDEAIAFDIFVAGGKHYVRNVTYEIVGTRELDTVGNEAELPLVELRISFQQPSGDKLEVLDSIIKLYSLRKLGPLSEEDTW